MKNNLPAGPNPLPPLSDFSVHQTCSYKDGQHAFSVNATYGKYEVRVSPSTGFGYFEHSLYGQRGELWFHAGALVDFAYHGMAKIPRDVALGLRACGFVVAPAMHD